MASLISGIMMRDGRCSYRAYSLGEKNRPMPTMALLALLVSETDMLYMGCAGLPGVRPNGPRARRGPRIFFKSPGVNPDDFKASPLREPGETLDVPPGAEWPPGRGLRHYLRCLSLR